VRHHYGSFFLLNPCCKNLKLISAICQIGRFNYKQTSNRPVEDWGKLLGDAAAVTAMLDRLLHHGHVLKCGPRSWRTKLDAPAQ
jgi:DNA replication protein DnaC